MEDPGCHRPGELAEAMTTKAAIQVARRLGPSHPFVKEHFTSLLEAAETGPRLDDYFRETRYEHQSGDVLRGPMSGCILLHILSRA